MNKQSRNLFVGIPNLGNIRTELALWLIKNESLIKRMYTPIRKPNDVNENQIIHYFLEQTNCEYFLSIDSDIAPINALIPNMFKILDSGFDVIGYPAPILDTEQQGFKLAISKKTDKGWFNFDLSGQIEEVDFIGGACFMTTRKVLKSLKPPFFKCVIDNRGLLEEGADFYFCKKVKDAGFKIGADLRFLLGHKGNVDFRDLIKKTQ